MKIVNREEEAEKEESKRLLKILSNKYLFMTIIAFQNIWKIGEIYFYDAVE